MIKIINNISEIAKRSDSASVEIEKIVFDIIADVKTRGDEALFEYAKKFDGAILTSLEVTKDDMEAAYNRVDADFIALVKRAHANIERFHKLQKRESFEFAQSGIILGQKITAIEKVGVYIPGGKAFYPSSVLMNVIPAKIAGVKSITAVSPPQADGTVLDEILACAYIAGVDKFYKIGGAGAVAALAYGTKSVSPVYKITGPGNAFVATAKKMVFGDVDIDMIAGPSEILVIADDAADPFIVAGDMLSQAEHDTMASAILVTTSNELALKVQKELEEQIARLPKSDICRASIDDNSYIIIANSLEECFEISNEIAPEHLEVMLDNAKDYLPKVQNAGSIFLGFNTPEALGDYYAGVNHVLPTNGTAKFSSALSVDSFIKTSTYVSYSEEELRKAKSDIENFAMREELVAHARSVTNRFERSK